MAFVGHVAVVICALLAGTFTKPSSGGGIEDLAAIVYTLAGGELLLGLVCLVGGAVMFRKQERERGIGLAAGWLVGLAMIVIIIRMTN